jgi:hypothetical protein
VPLDDAKLAASTGWTVQRSSAYYGGSARRTTTHNATLSLAHAYGSRLALIATPVPSGGSVEVLLNGRRIGTASLNSSPAKYKAVYYLPAAAMTAAAVTIRVTSSGHPVTIDGLAALR